MQYHTSKQPCLPPLYLLSHVDVCSAESVLHTRGLSTELHLVCRSSLHPADCHHVCRHSFVTVEGELNLLGLPGQKSAMQREDVKHLLREGEEREKRGRREGEEREEEEKRRGEGGRRKRGRREGRRMNEKVETLEVMSFVSKDG